MQTYIENNITKVAKNPARYVGTGAIILISIGSMLMNVRYAYSNYAIDIITMCIFIAVTLSFDGLKMFMLGWSVDTLTKGFKFWLNGLAKLSIWMLLVTCSAFMALSTVSDAVLHNPEKVNELQAVKFKVESMSHIRTNEELVLLNITARSQIPQKVLRGTMNCTDITLPSSRKECSQLMAIRLEQVQATIKYKYQKRLEQLVSIPINVDTTNVATLVSLLLFSFGFVVSPESIDIIRIFGFAGVIEAISAMGLYLTRVPRRKSNKYKYISNDLSKVTKVRPLTKKELEDIDRQTADLIEAAITAAADKKQCAA